MLPELIEQLNRSQPLTATQVADAVKQLTAESVAAAVKADFLTELAKKGETHEEIFLFAQELRALSITPPLDEQTRAGEILDVCGTGGDHLGTFNISTTVALVCAAAGVKVAKHGNRAITSKSGSADVLEALGIRVDLSPAEAARSLAEHNFAFFFAPNYHPAFKHIAPARKLCAERGQRTIFNILGPLLNPARPTAQLMGVPRPELCEPLARVLQSLGVRRGMVVCGSVLRVPCSVEQPSRRPAILDATRNTQHACFDELSTLGENSVAEFYQDRGFAVSKLSPENFPIQPATLNDLLGGDRDANANIIRRILSGEDRGPKRDAVLLNAGAALFVAGRARSIGEGWELAEQIIKSGKAAAKLLALARG
ncbi:MAG: anthranilate phosphoribosyltransferase [Verrucomicrobia bacterium]|nr:MAG: anthranilate phosphoribosyltransferase [Verrucomicrobiota bacterium]